MKKVSLVITDLDNTLWDWFGIWHASFSAMVEQLLKDTNLPRATVLQQIKAVHERHHTSEYSFVLQELPCLRELLKRDVEPRRDFPKVVEAYQAARRENAAPYVTVKETLVAMKARGARIVAFTESQVFYTSQRIRDFGLDGIIDVLYSTPDESTLSPEELEKSRKHPPDFYELKKTIVRKLPNRLVKPSPEILSTILKDENTSMASAIYIGDSLTKDIAMASDCGVTSVYAKYGVSTNKEGYELLRQVTHWNSTAVEREKHATDKDITPDVTLEHVFAEVMHHFDFGACACTQDEDLDREVEIWKETVSTQRHFNELQLSLRNILVTLLTAVVGAAGYALTQHVEIVVLWFSLNLGSIIALGGIAAVMAIRHFDRGYHALLIGAVKNGSEIEKRLLHRLPGIGLAQSISKASQDLKFLGCMPQKSIWRVRGFYYTVYAFLFILAVLCNYSRPATPEEPEIAAPERALNAYHSSGYSKGVEQVALLAMRHMESTLSPKPQKPTMICDIDETALGTWPLLNAGRFAFDPSAFEKYVQSKSAEPILPILRLYEFAIANGVEVIFLSSRAEHLRRETEANLKSAGFKGSHTVLLKSEKSPAKTAQYKRAERARVAAEGATIILNIGDQLSDLDLPPGPNDFLIPNPFYVVP